MRELIAYEGGCRKCEKDLGVNYKDPEAHEYAEKQDGDIVTETRHVAILCRECRGECAEGILDMVRDEMNGDLRD